MNGLEKIIHLNQYMGFEITRDDSPGGEAQTNCPIGSFEESFGGDSSAVLSPRSFPIYMAAANGRPVPILKTVLTSACERNCRYCAFSARRDYRRISYKPEELAQIVDQLYRGGLVRGAFLSSGVAGGGMRTQDRLLETAEILRNKLHFQGYLHLKIMPGAERAQVERSLELADRVSINLEAPSTERLRELAPEKVFLDELLRPLQWVEEIRNSHYPVRAWKQRWPSTTTQFVVGGTDERDVEFLKISRFLHRTLHLRRVYFSGFRPVSGTPLEDQPSVDPVRVHRLYQAAFLLRDYGFEMEDFTFSGEGNLPLESDPKYAWAQSHLAHNPVEVNQADFNQLLRVPGIGPVGAQSILTARRRERLRSVESLKALGVRTSRAVPFILLDGRRPPQQLSLW